MSKIPLKQQVEINPRVDVAFKKIFGTEENKDLLISFINAVISEEEQIVSLTLLNPYNLEDFLNDKGSILDIKAKDAKGNLYDIEVQITDEGDYDKRALHYWAKLYSQQITKGAEYKTLSKAIGIHILNFTSIPDCPNYANRFVIMNSETKQRHFHDLELYTIELSKFSQGPNEDFNGLLAKIKTGLDRWAAFLTKAYCLDASNLPKELQDPHIKKAMSVLTEVHFNKTERDLYDSHLKWLMIEASALAKAEEKGREKGREEGREEGEKKEKIEMIKKRLKRGHPQEEIAEDSGFSLKEIKKIQTIADAT